MLRMGFVAYVFVYVLAGFENAQLFSAETYSRDCCSSPSMCVLDAVLAAISLESRQKCSRQVLVCAANH